MVDDMTSKFGKISIGIHGHELPKYSENPELKEWWKVGREPEQDVEDSNLDDSIYQLRNQVKNSKELNASSYDQRSRSQEQYYNLTSIKARKT